METSSSSLEPDAKENAFGRGAPTNPFSVQRIGPGNIEYRFRSVADRREFEDFRTRSEGRMEFVAPHGYGKSTLLHTLFDHEKREKVWFKISDRNPRLPMLWPVRWRSVRALYLDSAELLSRPHYERIVRWAVGRRLGFIATRHTPSGLLPHWELRTPHEVVAALARELAPGSEDVVDAELSTFDGDARSFFGRLYQAYEAAHRRGDCR